MALSDLQTAIDNVDRLIRQITASPQPDYTIDGVTYSFATYLGMLIDKRLALRQAIQTEAGQYEIVTRGVT